LTDKTKKLECGWGQWIHAWRRHQVVA
jgi:hypothetical protein